MLVEERVSLSQTRKDNKRVRISEKKVQIRKKSKRRGCYRCGKTRHLIHEFGEHFGKRKFYRLDYCRVQLEYEIPH